MMLEILMVSTCCALADRAAAIMAAAVMSMRFIMLLILVIVFQFLQGRIHSLS